MSLARKSLYAASAAVSVAGGRLVLLAVLARKLSPEMFGQFVYAQWLVEICVAIGLLGAQSLGSRFFAQYQFEPHRQSAFFRRWIWVAVALPLLAGVSALMGEAASRMGLSCEETLLLGVWAASSGWWAMQTSLLTGCQRFGVILSANVSSLAVGIVVIAVFPIEQAGFGGLALLMACMAIASACFSIPQSLRIASSPSGTDASVPWSIVATYSLNMWITGLLWSLVWSRGELPVVRTVLGDEGVATYVAALTLLFGAIQSIMIWVTGLAPHLTSELGAGRRQAAGLLARRMSDLQIFVAGCAALSLVAVAPELMQLVFGRRYVEGSATLAILSFGLVSLAASSQNHLLQIETDGRFNRNVALGGVVVLYAGSALAASDLGVVGVAIARVVAMWFMMVVSAIYARRAFGPTVFSYRNVLLCGLVTVVAWLPDMVSPLSLGSRVAILGVSTSVLALAVRGPDGSLVAFEFGRKVRGRLSGLWR